MCSLHRLYILILENSRGLLALCNLITPFIILCYVPQVPASSWTVLAGAFAPSEHTQEIRLKKIILVSPKIQHFSRLSNNVILPEKGGTLDFLKQKYALWLGVGWGVYCQLLFVCSCCPPDIMTICCCWPAIMPPVDDIGCCCCDIIPGFIIPPCCWDYTKLIIH